MAFGFGKDTADNKLQARIDELEAKLSEAQAEAKLARDMLESVNNSTHLGIWAAYYNDAGENDRVIYSDEFRRMLGYTKAELPDDIQSLG